MEILFISAFCSQATFNRCFERNPGGVGIAPQKFFFALLSGCVKSGAKIRCVSQAPYGKVSGWVHFSDESELGISFTYVPDFNLNRGTLLGRVLALFLCANIDIFSRGRPDVIFCDAASLWQTVAALGAGKLWDVPVVGAVTDLQYLNPALQFNRKGRLLSMFMESCVKSLDGFLIVAPKMHEKLEVRERPSVLIEGVVMTEENRDEMFSHSKRSDSSRRVLLYAGYMHEDNGIGQLVEAFLTSGLSDVDLVLYGPGPMVEMVVTLAKAHPCIRYGGVVSAKEMAEIQQKATVLINPRPNSAWFAPYSFPSKQFEYMLSGVPTLTMYLPSMPDEYVEHVYLIKGEGVAALKDSLVDVFSKSDFELLKKGSAARDFIIKNKNSNRQGQRFKDFLEVNFVDKNYIF